MTGEARGFQLWGLDIYMETGVINQPPCLLETPQILQSSSAAVKITRWPER